MSIAEREECRTEALLVDEATLRASSASHSECQDCPAVDILALPATYYEGTTRDSRTPAAGSRQQRCTQASRD
jgi:hypothetical protein